MAEEDLIFGKKRHLFGGIEPSNMKVFKLEKDGNHVKITASIPDDTIVNGQTLCTIAGAIIRRKNNDYPQNEFDGEFVADMTSDGVFIDDAVSATDTLFYSAFPYTTQGVYNKSEKNRASINTIPPISKCIITTSYIQDTDKSFVGFDLTLPSGTTGAVIRKSQVSYPRNEKEGELVLDVKANGKYQDTNVKPGYTYLYSIYPYDSNGVYYKGTEGRYSVETKKRNWYFGFDLTENNSNPKTRVTYPAGVDNASYTPVKMNYSTNSFEYGGWNISPGEMFMPKPCMLRKNGTVAYYLNPNDYSKKVNGTPSNISDFNVSENAMMEWSKFFTKRWVENGVYKFRCCDIPLDNTWDCWCNYDKNDNQIPHFYTSIYPAMYYNGQVHSKSSKRPESSSSPDYYFGKGKYNGEGWNTDTLADRLLINDLLILISKSTDLTSVFGNGQCDGEELLSGRLDDKGMFFGYNNNNNLVKVFGMESYWGTIERVLSGWLVSGSADQKIKITIGKHDGTTTVGFNVSGNGYKTLPNSAGLKRGYISKMKVTPYGRFPVEADGSSTTYENGYIDSIYSGHNHAAVGGWWYSRSDVGPFSLDTIPTSRSDDHVGFGLSCKPTLK